MKPRKKFEFSGKEKETLGEWENIWECRDRYGGIKEKNERDRERINVGGRERLLKKNERVQRKIERV